MLTYCYWLLLLCVELLFFFFFWGVGWGYTQLTPGSAPSDHSWWGSGTMPKIKTSFATCKASAHPAAFLDPCRIVFTFPCGVLKAKSHLAITSDGT